MKIKVKINLGVLFTLLFITLKICKIVAWSWMWVLSPLWITIILNIIAILIINKLLGTNYTILDLL